MDHKEMKKPHTLVIQGAAGKTPPAASARTETKQDSDQPRVGSDTRLRTGTIADSTNVTRMFAANAISPI
jgi:hypothetical protein